MAEDTQNESVPELLRAMQRLALSREPRPPVSLLGDPDGPDASREQADKILDGGWTLSDNPAVSITERPMPWGEVERDNRSWAFHLHSWDFLYPLLADYHHNRSEVSLRTASQVVADWVDYERSNDESGFTWYDMAVGLRAPMVAYLIDVIAREVGSSQELDELLELARRHLIALAEEGTFAAHSNHGFYQAAGHLVLATWVAPLDPDNEHRELAVRRLEAIMEAQFTTEGVHREHSPDYHRMVLASFRGLVHAGLLAGQERALRLVNVAEDALAWFVSPNGALFPLGDTSPKDLRAAKLEGTGSEALKFALSAGGTGKPPEDEMRSFTKAGYAVVRCPWRGRSGFSDATALVLNAAFHSRTHKHADDLSFVWHDHGSEIVTDPGQYGYLGGPLEEGSNLKALGFWYADPNRVYVESTHAHSTVEIDESPYRRRGRKPFGSAIERTASFGPIHVLEAHVRHGTIRHARALLLHPGRWLIVFDWLWDNNEASHRFDQRFTLAPELIGGSERTGFRFLLPTCEIPLWVLPLLPATALPVARGQLSPRLLGWVSRRREELIPCPSITFSREGRGANFATLFAFSAQAPMPHGASCRATTSGRRLRVSWIQDGTEEDLTLERPSGGALELAHNTES